MKAKVAVLVSGGVDSSVALALLKAQGYDVTAFYLKIWLNDELSLLGECPWEEDLSYVRAVCDQLTVPLEIVPLQREYHERVVAYTVEAVKAGYTPNPDVLCNKMVKFGAFLDFIGDRFDYVATGHYAQVKREQGRTYLLTAPDAIKDQTYFLCQLAPEQIRRALFPIGHMAKEQVRALAAEFNLSNKDRKDSQGICFLGKFKFRDFIAHHVGTKRGDIIEYETGTKLSEHDGFWFYTIGQRQGIRLAGGPWYVVAKDTQHNTIFVSRHYYENDKGRNELTISACRWLDGEQPASGNYAVKLRHGPYKHQARVTFCENGDAHIVLHERDQGIAAGQFAVLYDGDVCLGGGVIVHEVVQRS